MYIEHAISKDVIVLKLQGKLLIGDGDLLLRDTVEDLVEAGHKRIILDFADVPYMDSTGLGEVVHCYTMLHRDGNTLRLRNLSDRLRNVLSVTRLLFLLDEGDDVRNKSAKARRS